MPIGGAAQVQAIFVNIFGGIMRCDTIARGILAAAKQLSLTLPVVVRLHGNNMDKAMALLRESRMNVVAEDDFDAAAERVVQLARATAAA